MVSQSGFKIPPIQSLLEERMEVKTHVSLQVLHYLRWLDVVAQGWRLKTILNVGHVWLIGPIQGFFNPLGFSKGPLVQCCHVSFFYGLRSSTNVANKYINRSHSAIHNRGAKVLSSEQQPVAPYSRLQAGHLGSVIMCWFMIHKAAPCSVYPRCSSIRMKMFLHHTEAHCVWAWMGWAHGDPNRP